MKYYIYIGAVCFVLVVGGFLGYQYISLPGNPRFIDEFADSMRSPSGEVAPVVKATSPMSDDQVSALVTSEATTPPVMNPTAMDLSVSFISVPSPLYQTGSSVHYAIHNLNGPLPNGSVARVWIQLKDNSGSIREVFNDWVTVSDNITGARSMSNFSSTLSKLPAPGPYTLLIIVNPGPAITDTDIINNTVAMPVVIVTKTAGTDSLTDLWMSVSRGTTLESYPWGVSGDDDFYDGGADTDTLQYLGNRSDYEVVRSPLSPEGKNTLFLVRRKSDDSLDIVLNIEIVVFKDQTVLVDDLFK